MIQIHIKLSLFPSCVSYKMTNLEVKTQEGMVPHLSGAGVARYILRDALRAKFSSVALNSVTSDH